MIYQIVQTDQCKTLNMMESIMPVKIFFPLIFLLSIIIGLSESINDLILQNFIINNPPATHYYPKVLLNLNKSDYKYTEKEKIKVKKIFNHTKLCERYENYLFNEKSIMINSKFDGNSSGIFDSIVKLNNKFISIMTQKIIDGNYVDNVNDDIYSTLELMENLNKFISMRRFIKGLKLEELLQNMIDVYHENKVCQLLVFLYFFLIF